MSVWQAVSSATSLSGSEGELVSVRVSVEPRLLEELLECLASLAFPVNPEIFHGVPTTVEFPAWQARLFEVRDAVRAWGFHTNCIDVKRMADTISASAH